MGDRLAMVDIDGVLARTEHRDKHAIAREWGTYFSLMHLDGVWPQGVELVDAVLMAGWDLTYLTGRREDTRHTTKKWLKKKGFPKAPLIMRREDDRTPLGELKARIAAEALHLYPDGVTVYDDDPLVIENVTKVPGAKAHHCTWYLKPARIVRRQMT